MPANAGPSFHNTGPDASYTCPRTTPVSATIGTASVLPPSPALSIDLEGWTQLAPYCFHHQVLQTLG